MALNGLDPKYYGTIALTHPQPDVASVLISPSKAAYEEAVQPDRRLAVYPQSEIILFSRALDRITTTPLFMYPKPDKPFARKYDRLRNISFDGFEFELPSDEDELELQLKLLPQYFFRRPDQGLGLPMVMKPLIKAVEALTNVNHLVISKTGASGLVGDTFSVPLEKYNEISSLLQRIAFRHTERSRLEREVHAYNKLVRPLDPEKYREKRVPYDEDAIFELLTVVDKTKVNLGRNDRAAIVKELKKHAEEMQQEEPEQLFQLQRQIELVSLDHLIKRFKRLLEHKRSAEKRWQQLFDLNPFILSMVFSNPIVVVLREATVGMPLITGAGQKVTDFLIKNPNSSNAALVEIKTPQEIILGKAAYRGDVGKHAVYGPSVALSSSVAQVLDQRYHLQKDIATIISNNEDLKLKTYHVDCVVVIGRTPTDADSLKSFEIYRNSLKDVRVVTFNELLMKLESLRDLLSAAPRADGLSDEELDVEEAALEEAQGVDVVIDGEMLDGDDDDEPWDPLG